MKKYRRKPALVESIQFDPASRWPAGVIPWERANYRPGDRSYGFVQTRYGRVHVQAGDWIVRSSDGVSVCTDEVFQLMYEPVEKEASV